MTATITVELTIAEAEFVHALLDGFVRFGGQLEPPVAAEVVAADAVVGKLGLALDDAQPDGDQ